MDETIGAKGGHNDRLRTLKITKAQKKKIQQYEEDYIKQLEKKVRKQQKYTLIKVIPLVVAGTIVHNLFGIEYEESKVEENTRYVEPTKTTEKKVGDLKPKKIITLPNGKKVTLYIHDTKVLPESEKEEQRKQPGDKPETQVEIPQISNIVPVQVSSPLVKDQIQTPINRDIEAVKELSKKLPQEIGINIAFKDIDFNNLDDESKEQLSKLRSRKIIEYYEDKLKEIRYDLRKTIYDYNVLAQEEDGVILSDEAKILLDRLTELISRIEDLKKKIDIEDLDKYDDNYIYVLIEDYINDFRDKKIIKEIKDSPLYILISSKLDELEAKRDKLSKDVEEKQEVLEAKEEDFDELKKKYYSIEQMNKELAKFQQDQERILAELRNKVANSLSEYEKTEYELKAMVHFPTRILKLIMAQMFLPGPKHAKALATTTAAYLYFLKNIYKPNLEEKKYRVIQAIDYSAEIERSISSIEDASQLLGKTSSQIDKMLGEITDKYKDYIGVIPECDMIISSLKKIKLDIEEKEYEMEKLKKQQELELEKNNAKVLKVGVYPVN